MSDAKPAIKSPLVGKLCVVCEKGRYRVVGRGDILKCDNETCRLNVVNVGADMGPCPGKTIEQVLTPGQKPEKVHIPCTGQLKVTGLGITCSVCDERLSLNRISGNDFTEMR